jgi:hypothetical protein
VLVEDDQRSLFDANINSRATIIQASIPKQHSINHSNIQGKPASTSYIMHEINMVSFYARVLENILLQKQFCEKIN